LHDHEWRHMQIIEELMASQHVAMQKPMEV